jgi:hypothetical protein
VLSQHQSDCLLTDLHTLSGIYSGKVKKGNIFPPCNGIIAVVCVEISSAFGASNGQATEFVIWASIFSRHWPERAT